MNQSIAISINFTPSNMEELLAILDRVDRMKSATVAIAPLSAPSPVENDAGPNETEYKRRTGSKRFRMTTEERESGKSREDVARDRLERLESGESVADPENDPLLTIPAPEDKLPDDGDLF